MSEREFFREAVRRTARRLLGRGPADLAVAAVFIWLLVFLGWYLGVAEVAAAPFAVLAVAAAVGVFDQAHAMYLEEYAKRRELEARAAAAAPPPAAGP